jgi:predicted aspartyl protease
VNKLVLEESLLLTDMDLTFKGETLNLNRVLVDTGSGSTVISSDLAESIGIVAEENDMTYRISGVGGSEFVYSKLVDSIRVGEIRTNEFELEIGAMNYGLDIDGIIGLDLLQKMKALINIDKLTLDTDC